MNADSITNRDQAQYWNGDEAAHWLVHEHRYERLLSPFTDRLLDAAAITPGDRVLDIGCGTGSTTRAAARAAVDGEALGVDLSVPLVDRARRRAHQDGLINVRFEHGDAQVHSFEPGGFDVAISRFGVMFFDEPATAFANIARGLRPGGHLLFVCWQRLVDNEWIVVPGAAAAQHVTPPPLDGAGPGPFSLGDRDRLSRILDRAGLANIGVEPIAEPLWLGHDLDDTVAFLQTTRFGQALLSDADAATTARVWDAVRAALQPHLTAQGVWLGSQAWLVTARTPTGTEVGGNS